MRAKFQLDEQFPHAVAHALRHEDVDVVTPNDIGLRAAPDQDVLAFALRERRVLLTHDPHFVAFHYAGQPHAGIAFCEAERRSIGEIVEHLLLLVEFYEAEELMGRLEYL
jgi:predicted nuclease of predicted toxin-antitoxin system